MDTKDLEQFMDQEESEFQAKPWWIRQIIRVSSFLWYRVITRVQDWPDEIKWRYQRIVRGYSDCDVWGLNTFILEKVRRPLHEFFLYQLEHGHSLPMDFAADPAAWLVVLEKMDYAFTAAYNDEMGSDSLKFKMMNEEEKIAHNKKVQEGFELFGKYCMDLWD